MTLDAAPAGLEFWDYNMVSGSTPGKNHEVKFALETTQMKRVN